MNTLLRSIVLIGFVAVAILSASTVSAEVLCDFENGADSYNYGTSSVGDPEHPGLFRDTYNGSKISLSDNGAANDYLILTPYSSSYFTTTTYDTTPDNTSPYSLFYVPVGATRTVTIDAQFLGTSTCTFGISVFDPAGASLTNRGFSYEFIDYIDDAGHPTDAYRLSPIQTEYNTLGVYEKIYGDENIVNPIVRLSLSLTNNGDSATIVTASESIAALAGAVSDNLWSHSQTLAYGTDAGELNMDLANNGFSILIHRGGVTNTDTTIYADNLTISDVPEPASIALLASGLIGLLAYAWRKRK